ncbi:MAG: phospho-sugar mutase [Bacteroidota bacterium]|nr:phospho-sugar mutase [Bacteroidota bacterium]
MSDHSIEESILKKARIWLEGNFDKATKMEVKAMLDSDPKGLTEAFYRSLEFGTGGLRGIMGAGTNRMNKYTVGMATQGLANYLKKMFSDMEQIKVAVAYDSRNNSKYFARITSEVFAANGFKVFLFDDLRPTPELSFAIRHLECQSGVVITASHNPKEYNGYKAYWDDGAQLIPPHDKNVINEVNEIQSIDEVEFKGNETLIEMIGADIDEIYLQQIKSLSLSPEIIARQKDLKIVYTPIHGTGTVMVPRCLKDFGFENVYVAKEQSEPDGNFPTVKSPNPEEQSALEMALNLAEEVEANLVMATDPDADRVGIAVRDDRDELILLNGNQTASLLLYYIIRKWQENQKLSGKEYIVKTIVTSELLKDIANHFGVPCYDVLTGFKWIAKMIRLKEGKQTFIAGGEESYGYMIGDFVRDKDAVSSCALIAEAAAWAAEQGKSLYELLQDIYLEFSFYKESLLSVVKKGKAGAEEIEQMMAGFRNQPPEYINNSKVVEIRDYQTSTIRNLISAEETRTDLPQSNVLQFFLADGSKISVRPSGTEPKIKFYFGVKEKLVSKAEFREMNDRLEEKLNGIIKSIGI